MTISPGRSRASNAEFHQGPSMLGMTFDRTDTLSFGIGAIVVVVAFGLLIAKTHGMTHLDLSVSKEVTKLHVGALGALGSAVYTIFSPVEAILITALIAVVVWLRSKNLRLAATFAAVVAITWIPSDIVKILVHRSRPDAAALPHHLATMPVDPSYPSGHMVFVTSIAIALVFLAEGTRWKPWAIGLGVVAVVIVALSLVSDGVHYPSDVLASIVWSLGVAPLALRLWNGLVIPRTYRRLPPAGR